MTMTAYMPIPTSGLRKAERALAEQELLPHPKRPDTSNLLKAIEDAFKAVVWSDDARVAEHRLRKVYSPRPRLEVEVRPISTEGLWMHTRNDPTKLIYAARHSAWRHFNKQVPPTHPRPAR